jgi:hypothetical protein
MITNLMAQIALKRMRGNVLIDQFASGTTHVQRTRSALTFGRLSKQLEEMEFVLGLLECPDEEFGGIGAGI